MSPRRYPHDAPVCRSAPVRGERARHHLVGLPAVSRLQHREPASRLVAVSESPHPAGSDGYVSQMARTRPAGTEKAGEEGQS